MLCLTFIVVKSRSYESFIWITVLIFRYLCQFSFVCLSICLFVCLFVCCFACLFVFGFWLVRYFWDHLMALVGNYNDHYLMIRQINFYTKDTIFINYWKLTLICILPLYRFCRNVSMDTFHKAKRLKSDRYELITSLKKL